jgi:hypothetical protein
MTSRPAPPDRHAPRRRGGHGREIPPSGRGRRAGSHTGSSPHAIGSASSILSREHRPGADLEDLRRGHGQDRQRISMTVFAHHLKKMRPKSNHAPLSSHLCERSPTTHIEESIVNAIAILPLQPERPARTVRTYWHERLAALKALLER